MAQYKVLQDIESEDKLLGPLSLRQFIYAAVVIALGFVAFRLFLVRWYLGLPFVPPVIFFGLLAAPLGRDQPSEVWLLSRIRFFIKPRLRIWDQSGLKELVTITVPKKIEQHLTDNLSQDEVKSRLKALASTLDTRGWAVKNAAYTGLQANMAYAGGESDRLVAIEALPKEVDDVDINPSDDVLAEDATASRQFSTLLTASDETRKQHLMQEMRELADKAKADRPTRAQPLQQAPRQNNFPAPVSTEEQALLEKMRTQNEQAKLASANMRTLPADQPAAIQKPEPNPQAPPVQNTAPSPLDTSGNNTDTAILEPVTHEPESANSGGELRTDESGNDSSNEVVISLH